MARRPDPLNFGKDTFERPSYQLGPPYGQYGQYGEDPTFLPSSASDQQLRRMYMENSPSPMERVPFGTPRMSDPSRLLPSVPDPVQRPFFNRGDEGKLPRNGRIDRNDDFFLPPMSAEPPPGNFDWASIGANFGDLSRGSAALPLNMHSPFETPMRGPSPAVSRTVMLRRTATPPQRCFMRCKLCQYTGLFVFVCVLAVIGYAIYNGVISADNGDEVNVQDASRGNKTLTITNTTDSGGDRKTTAASGRKKTKTTTTTTVPPTTTEEAEHCKDSITKFIKQSDKDDKRCDGYKPGIYTSLTSCGDFFICDSRVRPLRVGTCPCGRIFHPGANICAKQKESYYQDPSDCQTFHRCTMLGGQTTRGVFTCHPNLGFDITLHSPQCKPRRLVDGCT